MHDPHDPTGPTNPFDDPIMDALERSIENPPGFEDPLAGNHDPHLDETARLLDALESHIEGTPGHAMEPNAGAFHDTPLPDDLDPEGAQAEAEETAFEAEGEPLDLPLEGVSEDEPATREASTPAGPNSRPPGQGHGAFRSGGRQHGLGRRTYRRGRGAGIRHSRSTRYCPESRDLVDIEQCESCEKYRHWPEGTDEEPRECWYDWQSRRASETLDAEEE